MPVSRSSLSRTLLAVLLPAATVLAVACSEETPVDPDPSNPPSGRDAGGDGAARDAGEEDARVQDAQVEEDAGDAASADDAGRDAEVVTDAEVIVDVEVDAEADAGVDAGPTDAGPPEPGAACAVVGESYARGCGECGEQTAYCLAGGTVGGYGSCRCSEECALQDPQTCAQSSGDSLILSRTLGQGVEKVFTLGNERILRVLSGGPPCSVSGPPNNTMTFHTYVRVHNPNQVPVRAELRVNRPPDGDQVDVLLAAYASRPANDDVDARKACLTGAENNCFAEFDNLTCMLGNKAPVVPAGQSIWVYVGNYRADDPASPFLLRATAVAAP